MKNGLKIGFFITLGFLFLTVSHGFAAGPKGDAEAAKHGEEASSLQVVEQETLPDFVFRQYNLAVLSHYSYLIGSGGEALIIDPARDINQYLKDAEKHKLKITRVYLTHSHADFIAGHIELMKATGAELIVNRQTGATFKHRPIDDNGEIRFGNVRAIIRTTPGHTPDGTCLLIHHPADSPNPKMVLTGDTLFIGSVGRPDLLEGAYTSAQLAALLFDTWNKKLSKITDDTKIYPAHGAGSLCGVHLSDEPVSTFGEQKKVNPYLQHKNLSDFVMAVIDGLREPPQYFKHNVAMNREGPPAIDWGALPSALSPEQLKEMTAKGAWLIDLRNQKAFCEGHIPDAINIDLRGRFETWTGIMIPWDTPFILIGSEDEIKEATFRLHRIGYDKPAGYLKDGMAAWDNTGLPKQVVKLVPPPDLYQQMQEGKAPIIVDVRLPNEWMAVRIGNVLNLPLDSLFKESKRLDPSMPVLMVCNSAYRSSLAAGIMQKIGFKDVRNLEGGGEAWIKAGLPTYGASTTSSSSSHGIFINLPERMSPEDLAKRLMDLPGSIDVVDIRPDWQYAEYHIQGSFNVPVQELLANPVYLNDKRPLIIVCRDGSISAAVGGALIQKTPRSIRYLSGGVMRYYDEIVRPKGIMSDRMSPASPSQTGTPSKRPELPSQTPQKAPPAAAPKSAPEKRKKSAGC
ncbi:rhodanese-like domain-containing protein [Thermodesulfobacteriota bacterium]